MAAAGSMRRSLLAPAALLLTACGTTGSADLAIVDAWVHDGTGRQASIASVTVREGRIESVGPRRPAKRVIDGRGHHLVPGLIDMHTHISAVKGSVVEPARYLSRGITTIRDLGGFSDPPQPAAASRKLRIVSAVATINGAPNAEFHRVAKTAAEAVAVVDQLASEGASLIKVHRALAPEVLPAVVGAAHRHGLKVTGHIPLGLHPLRACELGMDGVEHVGSLVEAYVSAVPGAKQDDAIRYLLSEDSARLYRCLKDKGVAITPTLILYASIARARAGSADLPEEFRSFIASMQAITLRLHVSGAKLLAGSDSSGLEQPAVEPGSSLFEEIALLRGAGIPPRDLLSILGRNAARTLGLAPDGRLIAAGRRADMLLLSSDPTTDSTSLERPSRIIVAGQELVSPTPSGSDD